MAYGTVKVDNITFDNGGSDQNVTVSGLYRATTSGVTLSGTIAAATVSGVTVIGSTTISGATVTGTTANFTSGNFSNLISAAATMSGALIMANQQQVRFREAVGNGVNYIALQAPAIVSADQTITLPDQTGTVITTGDNGSVSSTMLATNLTISAAAGSTAAPSIAFTGDLNTGIYSPGADTLAFVEGGTEAMRIDSSGNVGIGTSTPRGQVSIANNATGTGVVDSSLHFGYSVVDYYGFRIVNSNDPTAQAAGLLKFQRGTTSTWENALVIDNNGNVGIGTTSPGANLHVNNVSALSSVPAIGSLGGLFNATVGLNDYGLISGALNSGAYFFQAQTTNGTSATYSILLNPNGGNVGIGSTAPSSTSMLTVRDATNGSYRAENTVGGYARFGVTDNATSAGFVDVTNELLFRLGGTEKGRFDSSGRLLVGTSSSTQTDVTVTGLLQIQSAATERGISQLHTSNDASATFLQFSKIRSTSIVQSDDFLGRIQFNGYDGSAYKPAAAIDAQVDGTPGTNDMPGRLVFSTTADGAASPTERMRIDYLGRTNFLSSDLGLELHVTTGAGTTTALIDGRHSASANTTGNGTRSFVVFTNGNIQNTNGSYTTISDAKLKENIVDADSQWNDLKAIQIRNWNFKAETDHETYRQIGPIAQELAVICPGLVFDTPDRDEDGNETGEVTKGVKQSVLYMKAVKALQEAMERIETLEARLTAAGID